MRTAKTVFLSPSDQVTITRFYQLLLDICSEKEDTDCSICPFTDVCVSSGLAVNRFIDALSKDDFIVDLEK